MNIILSILLVLASCTFGTAENAHILARNVAAPRGTTIHALSPSGECNGYTVYSGRGPLALTAWGENSSGLPDPIQGFTPGEEMQFWATESEVAGDFTYRLYPYDMDEVYDAFYTYEHDGLAIAELLTPAPGDTAVARWSTSVVQPRDTVWTVHLRISAPTPLGAVIVELRSLPFDSTSMVRPKVSIFTPSAQTYFSEDTLAAAFIGAGSTSVTWTISGTGAGTLEIKRIRATDRNYNINTVAILGPMEINILPQLIVGDLNTDGVVDATDARIMFIAFVQDTDQQLGPAADVYPYPAGDGIVNLIDFYTLLAGIANGTITGPLQ